MARKHSVAIDIAGQKLAIRTDADETYIRTLAGYVNRRFEEVGGSSPTGQTQKHVALVTLNLADELFQERKKRTTLKQRLRDKASTLLTYLEKEERKQSPNHN